MNKRLIVLIVVVAAAALARLLPHPPNVTPIAAMALFGGACLTSRRMAYLVPMAAMLLSDLVLGFTHYGFSKLLASQPVVYACILATTAIGQLIQDRRSVWQVGTAPFAGSLLFYLVTNFAYWATMNMYPMTWAGLLECYTAAIPYFRNSLSGDFAFTAILFGGLAWLESRVVWMREKTTMPELA
ncbi:MAG: DUF6580 family putative transport protein [Isosphaeraceae bacterium]